MQFTLRKWISAGILGSAFVLGCQMLGCKSSSQNCCNPCSGSCCQGMQTTHTTMEMPTMETAPMPKGGKEIKETETIQGPSVSSADKMKKRSVTDITTDAHFAHAPDYSWLQGELQSIPEGKGWRVRYASVDEHDPYGGTLTLYGAGPLMADYKSGQIVRVEGYLGQSDQGVKFQTNHIQQVGN